MSLLLLMRTSTQGLQSAFDDVWGWWRADTYTGSSPTITLQDRSGNARHMVQAAGTLTPGTATNGQARMVGGGSTTRLDCAATLDAWPMTSITVAKHTNNIQMGFFGFSGTLPANRCWYGIESTNNYYLLNTNGAFQSNAANAGSTTVYGARTGYGSRVGIINGVLISDDNCPSIVRPAAEGVSIGTQYRGLNGEWQETLTWNRLLSLAELDEVHSYLNSRYGLTIPLWSGYSSARTILFLGQSNMSGRGDRGASDVNIPAEYDAALTGVNVFYGTPSGNIGTSWDTLNINTPNHMLCDQAQQNSFIGPIVTAGKEYIDRTGGSVYCMSTAQGSTSLEYDAALNYWDPTDNTIAHQNTRRMFYLTGRNWWKAARIHQAAGRRPDLMGVAWLQGEQDATVLAYANAYQANLEAFAPLLDAELGCPYRKFVLCRIHNSITETYKDTVRGAQDNAALNIRDCTLVNLDGYGLRDTVHLNVAAVLDLGNVIQNLLPGN